MDAFERYPIATGLIMGMLREHVVHIPFFSRLYREQGVPGISDILEGIAACREALVELGVEGDPVTILADWDIQAQLDRDPELRARLEAAET